MDIINLIMNLKLKIVKEEVKMAVWKDVELASLHN